MPRIRCVVGRWRRIRRSWGKGFCRPCRGWVFIRGMEPSAHALGYRLTALRAWGHGFGGARLPRCIGIEFDSSLRVLDADPDADTENEAIGIVYPTRRGLTRNPTGRSYPHASVSASVSGSESKTKRSIGIDPGPEADHPDAALFRWGIAG